MNSLLPAALKNFVDGIFKPPLQFLQLIIEMLSHAGSVVGKGISLNNYFGFFAYLPIEWQRVVQSALASITLLAILWLAKSLWNMYLSIKESGKWW